MDTPYDHAKVTIGHHNSGHYGQERNIKLQIVVGYIAVQSNTIALLFTIMQYYIMQEICMMNLFYKCVVQSNKTLFIVSGTVWSVTHSASVADFSKVECVV